MSPADGVHLRVESECGSTEWRLPSALSAKSPIGDWQPPRLQPITGDNNSEMHPRRHYASHFSRHAAPSHLGSARFTTGNTPACSAIFSDRPVLLHFFRMKIPRLRCPSSTAFVAALALASSLLAQEPRLANVSTLTRVGTGADVLTAGFFIGGTTPKQVVIRAVGPRLATVPFNVTGTLADPQLTVFGPNSATVIAASNDNWIAADAAAFTSVGAFALTAGSRDAGIVTALQPGSYTAQVSGVGGTTGIAIVEVYEVGTPSGKFLNLSTRAQVGGAAGILTPGFVITAGGGTRKLLIRAAGPALTPLGVTGVLADPTLTLLRNGSPATTVATNDNWSTPVGTGAASVSLLTAAFTQAGAFAFAAGSRDAALLVDLPAGNYTVQVTGVGGTSGIAIVELYDLTPTEPPLVTIAATKAAADETGSNNGEYTFTRTGSTLDPLTVRYGVGGSAVNGFDYAFLPGTVTIPSGATSVTLPLLPNPDLQSEGTDTVVLTLVASSSYIFGATSSATVRIADSSATLYVATVRPTGTATGGSTASGTASILLSSNGSLAAVNVTFNNLSSTQTTAHLTIGNNEDYVFNLPPGQVTGAQWTFTPTGPYSSAALLDALKSGNISVRIDTAKYPEGEAKGTFIVGTGTRTFTAPASPPAVSLTNVTAVDAARLLAQATFGPTKAEVVSLAGGSIDAWITAQLAMPFTSHRTAIQADRTAFGGSGSFTNWNAIHLPNRQSAWFKLALTAPDQLRQRVAYALSQILVVSDIALGEDSHADPLALYYDQLGNGAFGNFRTLLETITLSPLMGQYLSSLRNSKADPVTGQTPDENYAREIMQLFTIGLQQLQPDGTLVLGADGLPIATYDQTAITEMAKVFTGWAYPSTNLTAFRTAGTNYISPMQLFPAFHDDTVKNISPVSATPIPASQGGVKDLQLALDALFTHANTAPFISKLLIQRLVTSNPSPAYVYRVAQKFANDGTGTRGNLGAVVRAILTDHEARSPSVASNVTYGKLKEPLLRLTGLLRSFGATSTSGRFLGYRHAVNGVVITSATPRPATQEEISTINSATLVYSALGNLAQAALRSPTVFNFYHPDYVLPGPVAAAGLVAPEFEITDDNFAISVPNFLRTFVNAVIPTTNGVPTTAAPYVLTLNLTYEESLVGNVPALLDQLNAVLCSGSLSTAARTRITTALTALPTSTTTTDKVKTAVLLVLTSAAAAVQK
ncbi:MAG: DUF1800 family protein [Opitutus sp.]|nr:DUF1800 family protein [Opitutus sp.]